MIDTAAATGNRILGNSVFDNGTLGIDLGLAGVTANDSGDGDAGADTLQNFPVLTAGQGGVDGTLDSRPQSSYRIEYSLSPSCDPSGNGKGGDSSWARRR